MNALNVYQITLRGLIFAWINFRECRPQNISCGLIFENGQAYRISRGFIFARTRILRNIFLLKLIICYKSSGPTMQINIAEVIRTIRIHKAIEQ